MIRDNVELENRKLLALQSIAASLARISELLDKFLVSKKSRLERLIGR